MGVGGAGGGGFAHVGAIWDVAVFGWVGRVRWSRWRGGLG